jgi:TldD protein
VSEWTSIDDPAWEPALRAALRVMPGPAEDVSFFLEFREDLVIRWAEAGVPRVTRTRRSGLALRWSRRLVYGSNPAPGDAGRLAGAAGDGPNGRDRPSDPEGAGTFDTVWIPDVPWIERIEELAAGRDSSGSAVFLQLVLSEQRILVVRADGLTRRDRRRGGRVRVECRTTNGGGQGSAAGEFALPGGLRWDPPRVEALASDVAGRAERRRDAVAIQGEVAAVVLAPGLAGILAHELIGHALEGDTVLRGRSWLAARDGTGRHVGARGLTVIDDPRRARTAWRVDDEGVDSRPTILLRDGNVAGLLHDRTSARRMATRPTGHGRCASFREPVLPRMGCTFIAPGRLEPEEVIAGVRDGIYVRRMEAGSTDPQSGRAVLRVTDSDRIRNGKIEEPLRSHVLVVDGRSMLANTDRVAGDLAFDTCIGGCHRDGQPMAISVGAPTICIGGTGRLI